MSKTTTSQIVRLAEKVGPDGVEDLFKEFAVIDKEDEDEVHDAISTHCKAFPIFLSDEGAPEGKLVWAGYVDFSRRDWQQISRNEYWEERIEKDYFHREPKPVEPAPKDVDESAVLDSVAATLEKEGWTVHKRYRVQHGEIDALALQKNQFMVIEAKGSTKISDIAQALGQLLAYREQIAGFNVNLAIALPRMPNKFAQGLLAKHGVRILVETHE